MKLSVLYNLTRMWSGSLLFLFTQVILVSSLAPNDSCGWNITLETDAVSYVTTAGYPMEYPPSQHCTWVVTAPQPDNKIRIIFNPFFDLEDTDCNHDYVEVYDGGDELSPRMGKFCGRVAPPMIISSGSQLLIKFVTDDENNGAGFSIKLKSFKSTSQCSRNFTDPQGVITTPLFPKKYPNNLNCTFMILAPETSEIVLEFDSFDMEGDPLLLPGPKCQYDWLDIWDGLPEAGLHLGRYCGETSPGQVIAYSGILSMTVTTDHAITKEGFSANYTIHERSLPSGPKYEDKCRVNINLEIGRGNYLTSAGYPMTYPPSHECVWVLTAPEPHQKILINFNPFFDLEDTDCSHDYVEVYNGGDELSPSMGKFCGKVAPPLMTSSGNQLLIKFVTDNENHGGGFSVQYEVFKTAPQCSRNFTDPQGVIETPGFPEKYPNNLNCTFMILASNTSEIEVEFKSFDMEGNPLLQPGPRCPYDWLDIWDGLPAGEDRIWIRLRSGRKIDGSLRTKLGSACLKESAKIRWYNLKFFMLLIFTDLTFKHPQVSKHFLK
uniref:CUB domain-containing protein n=1 Tax=Lates calcarifer TaxID=8187 RepID=A0A4W6BU07_LATCA